MPGRSFSAGSSYRYGFNGKENDNEVKGEGNQQDYGMRIYDPRVGRFLSVDPLFRSYPQLTLYQFASNRVIDGIDLDGGEYLTFHVRVVRDANGKPQFHTTIAEDYRNKSGEEMARVHGRGDAFARNFYRKYSESFGSEGRGFKFVYFDEQGNQMGEASWQMRQNKGIFSFIFNVVNSGYYSGAGAITRHGPGLKDGTFGYLNNDYNFDYGPMHYADKISYDHDVMQEIEIEQPQGWLEDVRTLKSDRILLNAAREGLEKGLTNSKEDFNRTKNISIFFRAAINYKEWKEKKMRSEGLDPNSIVDQRKILLKDWKPTIFKFRQWVNKGILLLSGGGGKEKDRGVVKPVAQKTP